MSESETLSKSSNIVHKIALVLLFLMIAQPTFDNINALLTGSLVMGELKIDVTVSKMALHILAMVVGWIGFWWFIQRQKRGAYVSIAAHSLGLIATATQTPEMFQVVPPVAIAVFFVILLIVALGPIQLYEDQYS